MIIRCVRKRREASANAAATGDAQLPLEYDRLMEVKPASQDTVERWKELLFQAFSRAETGYDAGAHNVYIVCAVGIKYMLLSRNHTNAGVSVQELRINVSGENKHFGSQLKPVRE